MKMIKRSLFFAGIVAVLFQCAPSRIAGGGSGTETVGGCAFDVDKKPIPGISVSIRRSDFLDTGSIYSIKNPEAFMADTMTDVDGKFFLVIGMTGVYTIEMYDKHNAALARCTVNQYDSLYVEPVVRPTGWLSGRIVQAPEAEQMKFFIYFYGLARHTTETGDSGKFNVPKLPEGECHFKVIPQTPIYKPYESGSISIISGEPTELDPIEMQKADFSIHPDDSLIVRYILDKNGLQAIPVDSVVVAAASWPHRIIELAFDSLYHNSVRFTDLTSRIDELTELRKIVASRNMLKTVPRQIGNLKHLRELNLSNNHLTSLPSEIGNLDSLEKFIIYNNNELDSIPAGIGSLTSLKSLNIRSIHLDTLPSWIGKLRNLDSLDISFNNLKWLPEELASCGNLKHINAEINFIDSLPLSITTLGSSYDHKFIDFDGNSFCQLVANQIPQEIFNWLDRYCTNPTWRKGQNCQGWCIPQPGQ